MQRNLDNFTIGAKDIINTYSTINDRITVIYVKEFTGFEYNKLTFDKSKIEKFINSNGENILFILCAVVDNDENITFKLHKYNYINYNYNYINTTVINI